MLQYQPTLAVEHTRQYLRVIGSVNRVSLDR
jgi:hypothetical protein